MPSDNEPQIPRIQSQIIDERSWFVARDWYRFFLNLLNKSESGCGGGTGLLQTNEAAPKAPSSYQMHMPGGPLAGAYAAAANGGDTRPVGWAVVTGEDQPPPKGAEVHLFVGDRGPAFGGIWRFAHDGAAFSSGGEPWCAPPGGVGALTSVGEGLVWVDAAGQRVWKSATRGGAACAPRELRSLSLKGTNATYAALSFSLPPAQVEVEAGRGEGNAAVDAEL